MPVPGRSVGYRPGHGTDEVKRKMSVVPAGLE